MNRPRTTLHDRELRTILATAVDAARTAGVIVLEGLGWEKNRRGKRFRPDSGKHPKIEYKGRINLVTDIDRASQECILTILRGRFPDHEYLAEESEDLRQGNGGCLWVIDPIDGTTNYAHGYPCFSISIALLVDGIRTVGVVYDPWCDEMFTAVRGGRAHLNGRKITVSETGELEKSLLVTGFPYDIKKGSVTNLGLFSHLITLAQAVRRDGSAALDLAYVAAGRFDGFWELKLHPWDVAAGVLIIEEAGGKVSTFTGEPYEITAYDLLATNGALHTTMMRAIAEVPRDSW